MRGSWASGLDDAGARDLARDLVRYFTAFEGGAAEAARQVAQTWGHVLDDPSASQEVAGILVDRARQLPQGTAALELQLGLSTWML
jgi:hypothetical protein